MATPNFEEVFSQIRLDQVPTADQLIDVWFYMNYHLNFHRLFTENRPVKIEQQFKNLRALSDIISPENGFALYFLGYLQSKVFGKIEPEIIQRLEKESRLLCTGRTACMLLACPSRTFVPAISRTKTSHAWLRVVYRRIWTLHPLRASTDILGIAVLF